MKKRQRPFAFIEDWNIFPDQTLVIVGRVNKEQAIRLAKKIKASKAFLQDLNDCNHPFDKPSFARMGKNNFRSIRRKLQGIEKYDRVAL